VLNPSEWVCAQIKRHSHAAVAAEVIRSPISLSICACVANGAWKSPDSLPGINFAPPAPPPRFLSPPRGRIYCCVLILSLMKRRRRVHLIKFDRQSFWKTGRIYFKERGAGKARSLACTISLSLTCAINLPSSRAASNPLTPRRVELTLQIWPRFLQHTYWSKFECGLRLVCRFQNGNFLPSTESDTRVRFAAVCHHTQSGVSDAWNLHPSLT
jgi:hypothetical protein